MQDVKADTMALIIKQKHFQSTIDGQKAETFEQKKQRLETTDEDYAFFMDVTHILGLPEPDLDVFASEKNKKCPYYLDENYDSLKNDWLINGKYTPDCNWVQPPFGDWNKAILQLHGQYQKYKTPTIALIPSRFEKNPNWAKYVEKYRINCSDDEQVFYFGLAKKFKFKLDGKVFRSKKGQVNYSPDGFKLVFWLGDYVEQTKSNIPKLWKWLYGKL